MCFNGIDAGVPYYENQNWFRTKSINDLKFSCTEANESKWQFDIKSIDTDFKLNELENDPVETDCGEMEFMAKTSIFWFSGTFKKQKTTLYSK